MNFNAIQILLVAIWAFIVAIDQFDFLESLYQPIVTGACLLYTSMAQADDHPQYQNHDNGKKRMDAVYH